MQNSYNNSETEELNVQNADEQEYRKIENNTDAQQYRGIENNADERQYRESRRDAGNIPNGCVQCTYAGFFVRMSAYLVDSLIVGAALLILRIPLHGLLMFLPDAVRNTGILFSYTIMDILLYIARSAYFIGLTYCTGATFGKRLFHLRVVSQGVKPSLWNMIYRETIGRFLSGVCMNLGYIVVGVDKEKRGIHDMLSDTRVIYERTMK